MFNFCSYIFTSAILREEKALYISYMNHRYSQSILFLSGAAKAVCLDRKKMLELYVNI